MKTENKLVLNKKNKSEVDLRVNDQIIKGHIRALSYKKDNITYEFFSADQDNQNIYDFIKEIEIAKFPNGISFQIWQVLDDQVLSPIEQIPYPFNSLIINKFDDKLHILVHHYNINMDINSYEKWSLEYYFSEFQKVIHEFPLANIIENSNQEFNEGRLQLEIIEESISTVDVAFRKAMSKIKTIVETVEERLSEFQKIQNIIEAWNKNRSNKSEEFWQQLFTKYPEIVSQSLSLPFVLFKDKAYLGGTAIDARGSKIIDYAYKNNLTNNIALIEIKTPDTKLMGGKYRNSFSVSHHLSGSISQLLKYKDNMLKEYYSIKHNSFESFDLFNPKCLLIIGSIDSLEKPKREAFELFRSEFKTIDIITFDELFEKIYILLNLLQKTS